MFTISCKGGGLLVSNQSGLCLWIEFINHTSHSRSGVSRIVVGFPRRPIDIPYSNINCSIERNNQRDDNKF